MYLLQDKKTGLWCLNKSREGWTEDKNLCRPFMSISGAKNSRWRKKWIEEAIGNAYEPPEPPDSRAIVWEFKQNGQRYRWHKWSQKLYRYVPFDERYRVVLVKIK